VTTLRLPADCQGLGRPRRLVRHALACAAGLLGLVPGALGAQTVSEVQVTPETMTLAVGQKQPIFATAYDRQGNLIASAKFTFWSSDTSIAKVTREGSVQGVAAGPAGIAGGADYRCVGRRRSGGLPAHARADHRHAAAR
jgi:hypothetical protein